MFDTSARTDLINKYKLAGKIRLISFSLLLVFLVLMKLAGGYTYLNTVLLSLILVEAILNQPYRYILKRVDIHRLQYYQMTVDILAITWLLYYMGGIDAPVVGIAYYAVILWAGVVSSYRAVFFAVALSALSFTAIVLLEFSGMLSEISIYHDKIPLPRMISLLIGNISYLFAFGYFSAHSSKMIKALERKTHDETLKYVHRFAAIDHLIGHTTHDMLGRFYNVKSCAEILLREHAKNDEDNEMLQMIMSQQEEGVALLRRLSMFSRKYKPEYEGADINEIIEEAIKLTWPVVRYSKMTIRKKFDAQLPHIAVIKDQIQEVFVAVILNALDAAVDKSALTITTKHDEKDKTIEITMCNIGVGIKKEYSDYIKEPNKITQEYRERFGIGLAISNEIIAGHGGMMQMESILGGGVIFTIILPVKNKK